MRTLCDSCESAAAAVFCAADEAALCRACDEKVHLCNKLASRHVRVGLANPSDVPRCDICENAPAFFYCEVDGSSLCLQCDLVVHVGGKRTHKRYLLLRQRVEFPGGRPLQLDDSSSKPINPSETGKEPNQPPAITNGDNHQNHVVPSVSIQSDGPSRREAKLIDLNMKPQRTHDQAPNNQWQTLSGTSKHDGDHVHKSNRSSSTGYVVRRNLMKRRLISNSGSTNSHLLASHYVGISDLFVSSSSRGPRS